MEICVSHAVRTCALSALVFASACVDGKSPTRVKPPESLPEALEVGSGRVTVGFRLGTIRQTHELPSYAIMRHPVTRAQYGECVASHGCGEVTAPACSEHAMKRLAAFDLSQPDSPMVCMGEDNAQAYCAWLGGRLPNLAEWTLAARGASPQLHPWGKEAPTCEQHPLANRPAEPGQGAGAGAPCVAADADEELTVGKYAAHADDAHMQDVLLVSAELLQRDADAAYTACQGEAGTCLMSDTIHHPGGLAFVYGMSGRTGEGASQSIYPYAVRCVLGEED